MSRNTYSLLSIAFQKYRLYCFSAQICTKCNIVGRSPHRFCRRQNIVDVKHHIIYGCSHNIILCPPRQNDVFASQKMMLTESGQTMLCPCGHKHKKKDTIFIVSFFLVLVTGLEPVRCCHRGILSPLRLPISPHQHIAPLFHGTQLL